MALSEEVIALVHDLSSAGVAVTLIGAPTRNPEASKSEHSKLSQSDCNSNDPTREIPSDDASISQDRDGKKPKYSSMSAEVCPTRDREILQKKLGKKVDVRYMNEIKSIKDRIKQSLTCNQEQCPAIQERLTQHQLEHHRRTIDYACGTRMRIRDQAINVSPTLSRMRLPKFTLPLNEEGRTVQTDITLNDFSPNRFSSPKSINKITSDFASSEIPLRKTETREVLPKRNFYKEHLQNEILNWLHHVPMFYSLNFTTKDIKENIVNNLAEKINTLSVDARDANYELKTKIEIENCLSRLPMWLHGSKQDQQLFKEGLREKLWNKIQGLNENFLGIKYEKAVGFDNELKNIKSNESYEKEVIDWSSRLVLDPDNTVNKRKVAELIMKRLSPLLKIPLHTTSYKLILKGEIIDILDDLPLCLSCPRYRTVHLNRFAEELANRLLSIQIKRESLGHRKPGAETSVCHQYVSQVLGLPIPKSICNLKELISNRVGECLDKVPVCHRNDLKSEICLTFLDSSNRLRTGDDISIKDEICQYLRDTGKLAEDKTLNVAKMIIRQVKEALKEARNSTTTSFDSVMPQLSGTISVYRWGSNQPAATSTPKKPSIKEIPKLSAEERAYMDKVAYEIRKWMVTLPVQFNENNEFKETAIYDLAGDIMDHLKMEQLAPETFTEKDKYQNYIMYRWLYKFNIFDEFNIRAEAKPFIAEFLKQLRLIPVPKLTFSQHGTRQAMENIKHMETEHGWEEDFVPKGIDVLEDQISVWMNEQPSEIYVHIDKAKRDKQIHELALRLQDRLRNKSPGYEIHNDIKQWLDGVVVPVEKEHIGLLSENLKEKIIHVPQDRTLEARHEERKREMAAKIAAKLQMRSGSNAVEQKVGNVGNIEGDPDRIIREFISKYIEHYYDIDDPMARGAFAHLLITELRKLAPVIREEVYENFERQISHENFRSGKLKNELEYIKTLSDWLRAIPIEASYNSPTNRDRIDFINDLAKNILEIEEQRNSNPDAMEYNYLMASMILQSMHTYGLPVLPEHRDNTPLMVEQLMQKLVQIRTAQALNTSPLVSAPLSSDDRFLSQSSNISDIKEQDLNEFINDYIRVNGREIADDEVKLEAYTARLMKEIQKLVEEGIDPQKLTKAQVYEKFARVSIPTEECVKRYCLEIHYVKEITDWLKNLPLLPIKHQFYLEEERIKMMSELAEKMCDTDAYRKEHPNDKTADKLLDNYITNWISRLPLDKTKVINRPILIEQLMSRLDRSKTDPVLRVVEQETNVVIPKSLNSADDNKTITTNGHTPRNSTGDYKTSSMNVQKPRNSADSYKTSTMNLQKPKNSADSYKTSTNNIQKLRNSSDDNKNSTTYVHKSRNSSDDYKTSTTSLQKLRKFVGKAVSNESVTSKGSKDSKTPAEIIVEAIENWSNKLPIKGDNNEEIKMMKESIARRLYQKTGELNVDPLIFNDDLLYREMLGDEIDTQLENVPQNPELQMDREKLKDGLLKTIMETNKIMKEKSAGDNYRHKLETTIDASIPHPVQSIQTYDPGFEMYKNHLADMFILENFDHANNDVKATYEKRIRHEIDKHFVSAQNKNALPLTRDEIYNEIYSVLFKVPMPNESSVIDEVEQIKTRCIIDEWYQELPVLPTDNINELLERDKILSTLAKRIHETEKRLSKDESTHREIVKWLEKIPLLPENIGRDVYANQLQDALKSSASSRKYVPSDPKAVKGKNKKEKKEMKEKKLSKDGNLSQIPGPSAALQSKSTTAKPCLLVSPMVHKKPGDIIVEVVEEWCNQLPLISSEENNKAIRDNISTRIIIQISELNMDAEIFNDDVVYDELLDEEIENVLINLPVDSNFDISKPARKQQLKDVIKSIKPLIKEEKAKHDYKEELNNTVLSILKAPQDTSADKTDLFNKLKDEIVENFVQYNYNKNDEEGRQLYKDQVHDAVVKYCIEVREKGTEEDVDPLVKRNQLLCELEKIPVPREALKDEVAEIKMRTEVAEFLREQSIPEGKTVEKMRKHLAKRLNDIEKSGYTPSNEKKMKADISRCLQKLNSAASPETVDDFVNKLKNNEKERKIPPITNSQAEHLNQCPGVTVPIQVANRSMFVAAPQGVPQYRGFQLRKDNIFSNIPRSEEHWHSLTETPYKTSDASYNTAYYKDYELESQLWSSQATHPFDQCLGQSDENFDDFEGGNLLSPSLTPNIQRPGRPITSGKSIISPSASFGRPSCQPSQRSIGKGKQQAQGPRSGIRNVTSGSSLSRPSFGQIATPRQVAQSPFRIQTPNQQHLASRSDVTPDSLFQAKVSKHTPLGRPLPITVVEPVRIPTSAPSMHPRRSHANPEDAVISSPPGTPKKTGGRLGDWRPRGFDIYEEEEICICERCTKRDCRGLPFYMLAMEQYFEDNFGIPMWLSMRFPECFYY
ncbi:hypothetical protein B5X24_HaOG203880 [Helicoverpa armigera]|nr:hypothetical protein B5X24_HaOG203880 [Helicoverpa armigera]